MDILTINHIIYLTPDQRNGLLKDRTSAHVVGVSVPVWIRDGESIEPALEVFCQYAITNEPQEMIVASLPTGYRINLPQVKPNASEDAVAYDQRKLADVKDYGGGWLVFKQFQNIDKEKLQILHFVEIRDMEYYWDSVTLDSNATPLPYAY